MRILVVGCVVLCVNVVCVINWESVIESQFAPCGRWEVLSFGLSMVLLDQ